MSHRILKPLLVLMFFGISSACEAGPAKFNWGEFSRGLAGLLKLLKVATEHPEETKMILIGIGVLLALMLVAQLIKVSMAVERETIHPVVVEKKTVQSNVMASRSKLPRLLQVEKFRRPDIWVSNIPWGLLIINLILWVCDMCLCVCCLCYGLYFLFLLVPMLILTYYLYVGVYWIRIVIIASLFLVLSYSVCSICLCFGEDGFGEDGFGFVVMAFVSVGLIVPLVLPESNAWFRNQNGNVVDAERRGDFLPPELPR